MLRSSRTVPLSRTKRQNREFLRLEHCQKKRMGATRRVVLRPPPRDLLEHLGRLRLAISLAQWAAYQLSIWHEIITWYGWSSLRGGSEEASAFSPEDLYSNLVGIRIAGGVYADEAPFPDLGRELTQADFPAIAKAIQGQNRREFGADADRPD